MAAPMSLWGLDALRSRPGEFVVCAGRAAHVWLLSELLHLRVYTCPVCDMWLLRASSCWEDCPLAVCP